MKLIIAGSRDLVVTLEQIESAITANFDLSSITEIVSGACPTGVDSCGEAFARGKKIAIRRFPADWTRYGRSAGPRRNAEMARYADAGVVFTRKGRAVTPGSASMLEELKSRRKEVLHVEV